MLNTPSINIKIPNIWDFPKELQSLSILSAEYSKKLGHSGQIFQKIGKFAIFICKILTNLKHLLGKTLNNWDVPQT